MLLLVMWSSVGCGGLEIVPTWLHPWKLMSRTLLLGDQYALLSTPRPGGRLFCTATTLRCSTLTMDDIHEGSEAPTAPDHQGCN